VGIRLIFGINVRVLSGLFESFVAGKFVVHKAKSCGTVLIPSRTANTPASPQDCARGASIKHIG
jgi:uncharacterized OB-fold protein